MSEPLLTLDVYADGEPCKLKDSHVGTYVLMNRELEYVDQEWHDKAQYRKVLGDAMVQSVRLEVRR